MIDLHVHSVFSDGKSDIKTLLNMAEKNKLDVFSITDHNTVDGYKSEVREHRYEYSGKIISGCEVIATYAEEIIEILTYGVDINKFDRFLQKYFSEEVKVEELKKDLEFLYSRADKLGLKYNRVEFDKLIGSDRLGRVFNNEIAMHEENRKIYMEDAWNNNGNFDRRYVRNPNSEWYIDKSKSYPNAEQVIEATHRAGGLTFLAHPLEYRTKIDVYELMDKLKEKGLDGIEVFHISAIGRELKVLEEYAMKKDFYISGGSDFHRIDHPTKISIIGSEGNLVAVEKDIINNWIKKVQTI